MEEIVIDSVGKFHSAVESQRENHPVYRGEDATNYELRPKIGRLRCINAWNNVGRERAMLKEFQKQAVPFLRERPTSDWEWLALAKHHGLPTRLLFEI